MLCVEFLCANSKTCELGYVDLDHFEGLPCVVPAIARAIAAGCMR